MARVEAAATREERQAALEAMRAANAALRRGAAAEREESAAATTAAAANASVPAIIVTKGAWLTPLFTLWTALLLLQQALHPGSLINPRVVAAATN